MPGATTRQQRLGQDTGEGVLLPGMGQEEVAHALKRMNALDRIGAPTLTAA